MTLHDYECQTCHAEFEAEVERGERAWDIRCPHCDSSDVLRLWRAPAVIYRGKGFYVNDKNKKL